MQATKRIFDDDSYIVEFKTKVISCDESEKGFDLVLDSTAFFPEGGGQFPDKGSLNGIPVLDVQEDCFGVIHHFTEKPILSDETVIGKIDWERRFDFMQQHSGEHIFSGIANREFGANNVGFHLGLEETTVDLDVPLSEKDIRKIELLANEAVYKNIPVQISFPSEDELAVLPYRSKKKLSGKIRIVTFPGYDICACCGTHIKQTGEIGIIKVRSFQNYKGGTRLFMLCGKRAFADFQQKNSDINSISSSLSVKPNEVCMGVKRLENEITEHKIYESALKKEFFALKAEKLGSGDKICVFEKNLTPDELRRFCLTLCENFKLAAVFCGENGEYKYSIASKSENCSVIAKELNAKFNGRGGGKPELVQGGCSGDSSKIESFIYNL